MSYDDKLHEILHDVEAGVVKVAEAAKAIIDLYIEDVGPARLDHGRGPRTGVPEVIYAAGKSTEQLLKIAEAIVARNAPLLITRLDEQGYRALKKEISGLKYSAEGRTASLTDARELVDSGILIVTAGTSDIPVAEEAATTCEALGYAPVRLYDVGVAGIHRALGEVEKLRAAKVIIVIAGMEGALPSVVGGLVAAPVIAVPTSVGYGTSFGGITALLGMLNSCAAGVTVVNIDNGFGAAVAAVKIIKTHAGQTPGSDATEES
ncbi:MAG: nickel pincer cofactor biosynthesis protein LarB [bacterium]